jgi:hypothetical protein
LNFFNCVKSSPPQLDFHLEEKKEVAPCDFFLFLKMKKRKKSYGAKSGEYGGWGRTAVLFLAKNSCTM